MLYKIDFYMKMRFEATDSLLNTLILISTCFFLYNLLVKKVKVLICLILKVTGSGA